MNPKRRLQRQRRPQLPLIINLPIQERKEQPIAVEVVCAISLSIFELWLSKWLSEKTGRDVQIRFIERR
jgi:hypothetical protein